MRSIAWLAGAAAAIFGLLSLTHVYWALGGRSGMGAAIPSRDGKRVFAPSTVATLAIAAALSACALVMLVRAGMVTIAVPGWVADAGAWTITVLFLVRAIGDFDLVGFFKRVRGTDFAWWDTRVFSPLCLLLAFMSGAVALFGAP